MKAQGKSKSKIIYMGSSQHNLAQSGVIHSSPCESEIHPVRESPALSPKNHPDGQYHVTIAPLQHDTCSIKYKLKPTTG